MPVSYWFHAKRDTGRKGRKRGREDGVILGPLWGHFGPTVGDSGGERWRGGRANNNKKQVGKGKKLFWVGGCLGPGTVVSCRFHAGFMPRGVEEREGGREGGRGREVGFTTKGSSE